MDVETEEDRLFRAWRDTLPPEHWSTWDLGACRLGWDAGRSDAHTSGEVSLDGFSEALTAAMEARGVTLRDLAEQIGVDKSSISRARRGKNVSIAHFVALWNWLGHPIQGEAVAWINGEREIMLGWFRRFIDEQYACGQVDDGMRLERLHALLSASPQPPTPAGDDADATLAMACRKYNIGTVKRLDEVMAGYRSATPAGVREITEDRDRLIHILVVHYDMFRDKAEEAADLFLHHKTLAAAKGAGE